MGSRAGLAGHHPCVLVFVVLSLFFASSTRGEPATLSYEDCFSATGNITEKLNVSMIYGQILDQNAALNLTIIGQSNIPIVGRVSDSSKLGGFPFYN